MRELLVLADSHLTGADEESERMIGFLRQRGSRASAVAHLGDLFNIWLGPRRFERPHMVPVLDAFRQLRRQGVRTILVEGNRDYHVSRYYEGDAFDEVAERGTEVQVGSLRIRLEHGDLINPRDRQYRLWRAVSRSGPVWAGVRILPARAGVRLAEWLERRLRGTNIKHKSYFPDGAAGEAATAAHRNGCGLLVLGHFHDQHVMRPPGGGELIVLPDWRSSHGYLVVAEGAPWRIDTWSGTGPGGAR